MREREGERDRQKERDGERKRESERKFFFRACVRVSHAIHRCIMLIPAGLTDWKLNVRLFWRIDKQSPVIDPVVNGNDAQETT